VGVVRRDPMAMLPFCGYHMADYFNHWLHMGRQIPNPPRIFRVNWFRKDENGKFAWPGFGENMRVLKWIVDRVKNRAAPPAESPFGYMPHYQDLNWQGLAFPQERFAKIMSIDPKEARNEALDQQELFDRFGNRLPEEFEEERQGLLRRIETKAGIAAK
jgi:phosphoenolpyruvate carboxykinase (GTP)